ncbi:MAG: hypothetical protein AB1352_00870 [Patescibacteria group bacterium]
MHHNQIGKRVYTFLTGLLVIGAYFFPLPAHAQCCVCKINDKQPTGIKKEDYLQNVCYPTLSPDACDGPVTFKYLAPLSPQPKVGGNKISVTGIKTQNGVYYACTYQNSGDCAAASCPDVKQSVQAFAPVGDKMQVYVPPSKRDPIQFKPQVSIPGTGFISGKPVPLDSKTIGEYIAGIYYFLIASIGLLAVIGIMIGGFKYLMAGGSPEKITEAKSSIMSAIVGFIIALTSYLLFYTINPRLVEFDTALSTLEDVESQAANIDINFGPQECTKTVSSSNFLSIADPTVFTNKSIVVNNNPGAVEQPPRLMAQVIAMLNNKKLENWLKGENSWKNEKVKFTLVIMSAYRTMANQTGLRGCYDYSVATTPVSCPYKCSGCAKAATPSCDAPHQTGFAVDVCLEVSQGSLPSGVTNDAACNMLNRNYAPPDGTPPTGPVVKEFQAKMNEVGFDRFCEEWWHFESGNDLGTHRSACCAPGVYDINQTKNCPKNNSGDADDGR